ncbi:glutathione S-transferase omega-1-like [Anneissia japonica]|uniref:glutathione S-transferase omega-1-like n=1 Tax=Anneissia japonica TaxID=1529436 RepID=UPI0014256D13|nr:glutathione S-transferase omega-1-like [Anneissia japonica]XP_033124788.1 glutathione S-transferase omega-1-like [Anneissia japonica]
MPVIEETKHLEVDSPLPPLKKGLIRIYSNRFCPFAHRTRLVLAAKSANYEIININLKKKPRWYSDKNPMGTTPCLEKDDAIVWDSTITCDYLDDIISENPLWPTDPLAKAKDRMLIDFFGSKVSPNFMKLTFYPVEGKEEFHQQEYEKYVGQLEQNLSDRGTTFFAGAKPGMVDYIMWPWFERWVLLEDSFPKNNFPKILTWRQNMMATPAVKEAEASSEMHKKYFKNFQQKIFQYDY